MHLKKTRFDAKLLLPATPCDDSSYAFIVLPKEASELLPRRGRTTVIGTMNGHRFQATLDPDGKLSHWLKVSKDLQTAAGIKADDIITFEISPIDEEPEPEIPQDFEKALEASPEAQRVWLSTTTIARLDWIHWITTAKQAKTRVKRISDACEMLEAGKKRVCCFDPSGYYSKVFRSPEVLK